MTTHELAKLLMSLPNTKVLLQPTAKDSLRPCQYVHDAQEGIILSSTGARPRKKGGAK